MSKKRANKSVSKKRATKRTPLKTSTYHKRGTRAKSIDFVHGRKDPEKIVKSIELFDWSKFDYLRRKNKPDGHHYKPPQGITVIIAVKNKRKTYHYTKLSPYDFVVNKQSVKNFTKETVEELITKFNTIESSMEDDENEEGDNAGDEPDGVTIKTKYLNKLNPAFITSITVRFLYGKT